MDNTDSAVDRTGGAIGMTSDVINSIGGATHRTCGAIDMTGGIINNTDSVLQRVCGAVPRLAEHHAGLAMHWRGMVVHQT